MMKSSESKIFIKEVFKNVIENMSANEEIYEKYFSNNYIQQVDGKILNYKQFVSHMTLQKAAMQSIKVTFKNMIVEKDEIATIHIVNGIKKDGGIIEVQVNAVFNIKNNKVISCNELTHVIKGNKSDKDLASCH